MGRQGTKLILFSNTTIKKSPGWLIAIAGVFLFAAVAQAQAPDASLRYGDEYQTCNNGNTRDIVECVAVLTKAWDERLNAAFEKAMKKLPPPRQEGLRDVQRSWMQYRDANCRWYSTGEGTIAQIEAAECMRSMTAARAQELEEAIEEH